jgi:hypothetical protein
MSAVERSVGQLVQAVVEVQQRGGVVGQLKTATFAGAGDAGDERVGPEPRPGDVELVDAVADPGAKVVAERPVGLDLPARADRVELEHGRAVGHREAWSLISSIAWLNPSGVPLEPARRETRTSSKRLPATTSGTASAKRSW